ncbi:hypothetical protein CLOM_g22731 [Closterium sp. NIES-68]|nr:hypothetical protein CLOM_g22731 [Closterium sp. NIES-68]GJP60541.1 hypothetical protein CLOP_g17784 [Closterium sp. NIES-67]
MFQFSKEFNGRRRARQDPIDSKKKDPLFMASLVAKPFDSVRLTWTARIARLPTVVGKRPWSTEVVNTVCTTVFAVMCLLAVWIFLAPGRSQIESTVVVSSLVDSQPSGVTANLQRPSSVTVEVESPEDGVLDVTEAADPDVMEPAQSFTGFVNGPHAMEAEAAEVKVSAPVFPLCRTEGPDFIPCLDNEAAIKALKSTSHYEHRERHCPGRDGVLRCLLPLPEGYKAHVNWPESRDQIWFSNVPHSQLASYKADQNWIKPEGDRFIFPGGGTQFKYGVTKYITWLQETFPYLTFGKRIRTMLDMGCGVASFGAYLDAFHTRVLSVAPKDEHEAQVQFALERGVPALVGVMGTQRQPLPANVLDAVHCARCRVPWHAEGGKLLLEVNRLLRPGGYFIWSATPVCKECAAKGRDDEGIWEAMNNLTNRMCWKRVGKKVSHGFGIGVAVWQKPTTNDCYAARPAGALPPMCPLQDNPDAAWYIPMQACLHRVPSGKEERGGRWPVEGEERLTAVPGWLERGKAGGNVAGGVAGGEEGREEGGKVGGGEGGGEEGMGVYGRPAGKEYRDDVGHWERVVRHYVEGLGIQWAGIRNVLDMDAHYGGFGAALERVKPVWTMNAVPTTSPDTLPVVFDRGLLGVYHDWCEAFNTYPRTYDLVHSDHHIGKALTEKRCEAADIAVEIDRILRPLGYFIAREHALHIPFLQALARGLGWAQTVLVKEGKEAFVVFQKTVWRPENQTQQQQ